MSKHFKWILLFGLALVLGENRLRQQAQAEVDRCFALSLDILGIANTDGYFKRLNPAFTATLGWSVAELLARPFLEFNQPHDHAATVAEAGRPATPNPT